jgi:hypothetical protein
LKGGTVASEKKFEEWDETRWQKEFHRLWILRLDVATQIEALAHKLAMRTTPPWEVTSAVRTLKRLFKKLKEIEARTSYTYINYKMVKEATEKFK